MALPSPPIAQQGGDIDVDQLYRRIALLESRSQDPSSVAITGGTIGAVGSAKLGLKTFYCLGDSISADGGRVINSAAAPDVNFYQYSWQKYAIFSAGGGWNFGGTFGLAGQTIAQLKATYLPYLLSYVQPGDAVIVLMGQNDLGGVTAQTLADYRSVIAQLMARGITPILGTLTPGTNTRTWHVLNTLVVQLAAQYALPVIDFHAAVVNTATGLWQAALTRDTVHPTQAGAKAMGLAAGSVLSGLSGRYNGASWLAYHEVDYGPSRTTQSGGNTFPLFSTDNAATPPIPSGWGILTGSHSAAIAFAAASYGRKMTLTQPAGGADLTVRCSSANTALPGDVCVIAFWLTTTVKATGGFCRFSIADGAGVPLVDFGRTNSQGGSEDVARSLVVIPFVHSGTTGLLFDITMGLGTGSATAVIEQFTINNLAAMGLA